MSGRRPPSKPAAGAINKPPIDHGVGNHHQQLLHQQHQQEQHIVVDSSLNILEGSSFLHLPLSLPLPLLPQSAHQFPLNVPIFQNIAFSQDALPRQFGGLRLARPIDHQTGPPAGPLGFSGFVNGNQASAGSESSTPRVSPTSNHQHLPRFSVETQQQLLAEQESPGPDQTPLAALQNGQMRTMHSDLAILSADHYDDGSQPRHTRIGMTRKKSSPVSDGPVMKKRARPQASVDNDQDDLEPDEDRKRTRGRPRLDTKDQTPQDRRRTQIRLAQRAYRNRKDSAISDLQKEVDGLKEVNDQMNQAYQELFDYATRYDLLQQAPDLGQRLLKLQQKARQSWKNTSGDADGSSPEYDADIVEHAPKRSRQSSPENSLNETAAVVDVPRPPEQLWAGLVVTHEAVVEPQQYISTLPDLSSGQPIDTGGYEHVRQPHFANSSYPESFSTDQTYLLNPWTTQLSPYTATLPAPINFNYQELTFSRRLSRSALLAAARLVTMENPPPEKMMRVFGFARLFETYEQIRERTLTMLHQSPGESLNYWKYPFHNLGGAGTHFSALDAPFSDPKAHRLGLGSSGNPAGAKPTESAGFAMGPFDARVSKIRESLLGLGQRINLDGFDGVFWDSDEVAHHFHKNGVDIPASADYHDVEIEADAFGPPPSDPSVDNLTPSEEVSRGKAAPSSAASTVGITTSTTSASTQLTRLTSPGSSHDNLTSSSMGPDDSWLPVADQHQQQGTDYFGTNYSQGLGAPGLMAFESGYPMLGSFTDPNLLGYLDMGGDSSMGGSRPRRKVRIDVQKLLFELINKATCLGRTAGFRPKDVNSAFWASLVDPTSIS